MNTPPYVGYRRHNGDLYCFPCSHILRDAINNRVPVTHHDLSPDARCAGPCRRPFDGAARLPSPSPTHLAYDAAKDTCTGLYNARAHLLSLVVVAQDIAHSNHDPHLAPYETLLQALGPYAEHLDTESLYATLNQIDMIIAHTEALLTLTFSPGA